MTTSVRARRAESSRSSSGVPVLDVAGSEGPSVGVHPGICPCPLCSLRHRKLPSLSCRTSRSKKQNASPFVSPTSGVLPPLPLHYIFLYIQKSSPRCDTFSRIILCAPFCFCAPRVQAWGLMVSLAVRLLQGSLPGLRPHLLVNLRTSRATSAAVCRRCCLGQVVLRCASLRQALVDLGGDGADGTELVELLSGADAASNGADMDGVGGSVDGGSELRAVLSTGMLQRVLQIEADTVVAILQQTQARQLAAAGSLRR
eukprot:364570-Chlamydomonas_euryale.AAC.1